MIESMMPFGGVSTKKAWPDSIRYPKKEKLMTIATKTPSKTRRRDLGESLFSGFLVSRGTEAQTQRDLKIHLTAVPKVPFRETTISVSSSETGLSETFDFLTRQITSATYPDIEMAKLDAAVHHGDLPLFLKLIDTIDWDQRSVDDILRTIQSALQVGAHLTARKLAQEGGNRFPDHPQMAKHARILAPVKTIRSDLPPYPQAELDMKWLKEHRQEYHGQWVAIKEGNLIASASTFQDLKSIVGSVKNTHILVIKV
jgi:Family of unknown function (DUF5678)